MILGEALRASRGTKCDATLRPCSHTSTGPDRIFEVPREVANAEIWAPGPGGEDGLIIASINEIPGFGFAEALLGENGRMQRVGILELAPANALRLQRVMSLGEKLVYSGPVWVDDHWSAESFPISLSDERNARDLLTRVEFTERP